MSHSAVLPKFSGNDNYYQRPSGYSGSFRRRRVWPPPRPAGFPYPSPGDAPGLTFGAVNGISAAQFGKINDSFTDSAMVSAMDGFGIGNYGLARSEEHTSEIQSHS